MFLYKEKNHFLNIEIHTLLKHVVFKVWNYTNYIFFMSKPWCTHLIITGLFIRWLLEICLLRYIYKVTLFMTQSLASQGLGLNMYKREQVSILPLNRTQNMVFLRKKKKL